MGTVKAVTPQDLVLTTNGGQDVAVTLNASTRVLLVDPQTRDMKSAKTGTAADIAAGDKAIVTGTAGDSGQTMTAARVLLLTSGAIAAMHAEEQAAWAHSIGGAVRSVENGTLVVGNGGRTYTVTTTPATEVRRYAGSSVRFQDAMKSNVAQIRPGDQVQARGQRSDDGMKVAADEIVAGSFTNYSGTVTAVDSAAGTLTMQDLTTKQTVTIAVTGQTSMHKLPAGFGMGAGTGRGPGEGAAAGAGRPAETHAGAGAAATGVGQPGGRGGMDLSRIINRLPPETLADLKPGAAVMLVASNNPEGRPTAITVVSGVEQLLSSAGGRETTLSPWSLGSTGGEDASGGDGGGGR